MARLGQLVCLRVFYRGGIASRSLRFWILVVYRFFHFML